MKRILSAILLSLLTSFFANASTYQIACKNGESSVVLAVNEGVVKSAKVDGWLTYRINNPEPLNLEQEGSADYEFIVNDSNDTNTFFAIYLLDGKVAKRELLKSGNDSDNYLGRVVAEGDDAFFCIFN